MSGDKTVGGMGDREFAMTGDIDRLERPFPLGWEQAFANGPEPSRTLTKLDLSVSCLTARAIRVQSEGRKRPSTGLAQALSPITPVFLLLLTPVSTLGAAESSVCATTVAVKLFLSLPAAEL